MKLKDLNTPYFAIVAAISLSLSTSYAEESYSENAADRSPARIAVQDVADDSLIENRLQQILESAGWFTEVKVSSSDGVVTLTGATDSEAHREWASNLSRNTEDVVEVINRLDVTTTVNFQGSWNVIETSLDRLWRDLLVQSPLILAALAILLFTAVFAKIFVMGERRLLDNSKLRSSLKDLVYQLSSIAIWILGFFAAIIVAFPGMTPAKALTTLGLGTVAIGFAFKDIFENFFAGVLILWRYPFDRGDFIQCEGLRGEVEEITIRNTMIRRLDGELTVVPNATIFKNNVDVLTSRPQRRVRIVCGIAYGEDVDTAREVIRGAVVACDSVQGKRAVEVFANEFADSSVIFEVAWWTGSRPLDIRSSRDEVIAAIKRDLDQAGIEIPFPYRTLTFKDEEIVQSFASSAANEACQSGESAKV